MSLEGRPCHFQVSVKKSAPRDSTLPQDPTLDKNSNQDDLRRTTEVWAQFGPLFHFCPQLPKILKSLHLVLQQLPIDAGFQMTTVVFFTPAEKAMAVAEARGRGYGIGNTDSRLVLRSPKASPETYTQNVRGARLLPAIFPPQTERAGNTCSQFG